MANDQQIEYESTVKCILNNILLHGGYVIFIAPKFVNLKERIKIPELCVIHRSMSRFFIVQTSE